MSTNQAKRDTKACGKVLGVFVSESESASSEILPKKSVSKLEFRMNFGAKGDVHASPTMSVNSAKAVFEKGFKAYGFDKSRTIFNTRQFSAVSDEELQEVGKKLGLDEPMPYGYFGENLVISGIENFSKLPFGTLLFFKSSDGKVVRDAVLMVLSENEPCTGPGNALQKRFPHIENISTHTPKAAYGIRGVLGMVYSDGTVYKDDLLFL